MTIFACLLRVECLLNRLQPPQLLLPEGECSVPALQESILSAMDGMVAPGEEPAGAASAEAAAELEALRRQEVRAAAWL